MALPTVLFSNATGSDTLASGAGPGTALTGTGAAVTNTSNAVDLSADSPNLSGVAVDGSAVLYVATASGRKFSKITAADNGTKIVTVQDTVWTTGTGKSWAIGGKRKTLASSTEIGADSYGGWTIQWEDTPPTISAAFTWAPTTSGADGPLVLSGPSASSRVVFTNSANAATFTLTSGNYSVKYLEFVNTNGTKTSAYVFNTVGAGTINLKCETCVFGHATNKQQRVFQRATSTVNTIFFTCIDCEMTTLNDTTYGEAGAPTNVVLSFHGCWIHGNTSHGVAGSVAGNNSTITLYRNLIIGNGSDGVNLPSACTLRAAIENTIHNNTGDGIDVSAGTTSLQGGTVINNNITLNGGYGINAASGSEGVAGFRGYNNYGTGGLVNTLGALNNLASGPGSLAVDPAYIATGSNNYGVGAAVQDLAFPLATRTIGANNSGTTNHSDVGAAQHLGTGGGISRSRVVNA